jgi:multisubunit Na+/H+ antiporter MnhF subunit
MPAFLHYTLDAAILAHLALLAACIVRLCRGENAFDRLLAVDLIGTLLLAIAVLFAIREGQSLVLDVALGLAAVGFTGSILLAKYVADDAVITGSGDAAADPDRPRSRAQTESNP